jgi:hypothetical protein
MSGNGDILDPNAWSVGSPTIGVQPAAQGFDVSTWRYLVEATAQDGSGNLILNDNYSSPSFDDSGWAQGALPAGDQFNPNASAAGFRGTPATSYLTQQQIWLRRTMTIYTPITAPVVLNFYCDNGCAVWVNGVLAFSVYGFFGANYTRTVPASMFTVGVNHIAIFVQDDLQHTVGVDKAFFDIIWPPNIIAATNPSRAKGDIPNPNAWAVSTPTLGVGTLPALTGKGDIPNPNAWMQQSDILTEDGYFIKLEAGGLMLME